MALPLPVALVIGATIGAKEGLSIKRRKDFERQQRNQIAGAANDLFGQVQSSLGSQSVKTLENIVSGQITPFNREDIARGKRLIAEKAAVSARQAAKKQRAQQADRGIALDSAVADKERIQLIQQSQEQEVNDMLEFLGTVETERFKYPVLAANALKGIFAQADVQLNAILGMAQEESKY